MRALRNLVIASLAVAAPARAAYVATLPVRHLHPEDATHALYARVPGLSSKCRLEPHGASDPSTSGFRGTIYVACESDELGAKIASALAAIDVAPSSQKFHVVVLTAWRKDGPSPDLPDGEKKALADFKRVMSYKSFTVDAETMIATDTHATTQLNDAYSLEFAVVKPAGSDVVDVRPFRLMSLNAVPQPNGAQQFRTYLDTSFSIKIGETIVLGSSVSDQEARIVLVTALP